VVNEFGPKAPDEQGVVRRACEIRLSPMASGATTTSPSQMA